MFLKFRSFIHSLNKRHLFVCLGMILLLCGCDNNPKVADYTEGGIKACWPCAIYIATFDALETVLEKLIKLSCENAVTLLGFALLFWLLFHVGKFMVTIQEPNIRKFILPMTTTFFKATLVFSFIHDADAYIAFLGDYVVQPILLFFTEIAKIILDSDKTVKDFTAIPDISNSISSNNKLFGTLLITNCLEIVYRVYIGLKFGTSLGDAIFQEVGLIPFIFGIFILCSFWMTSVTMPLMFLDSFVRLAVVLILSPFALVGWIFPATKKMAEKIWGVFFGTGISFVFASFYIVLTLYLILIFADKQYPGILSGATQTYSPDMVEDSLTFSTSTLALFVLLISLNRLSPQIIKLANQFGGDAAQSSWVKAVGGLKRLAIVAAKVVLAVVLASPSLAKDAVSEVKDVAGSVAQDGMSSSGS